MSENKSVIYDTDLCRNNPDAAAERISTLEWELEKCVSAMHQAEKTFSTYDTHKMDVDAIQGLKEARFTALRVK